MTSMAEEVMWPVDTVIATRCWSSRWFTHTRSQGLHECMRVFQHSPAVFNKAAMMNIGFMEASRRFKAMDCVMFHDVDNLLEDDRALMNCASQRPHHYATAMDLWNYKSVYHSLY